MDFILCDFLLRMCSAAFNTLPPVTSVCTRCVAREEGFGLCLRPYTVLQDFNTQYGTRFKAHKIAWTPQDKNLGEEWTHIHILLKLYYYARHKANWILLFSPVTFKTFTKKYFSLLLFEGTFTSFSKIKTHKKSHKTVGINVFLTIFAWW